VMVSCGRSTVTSRCDCENTGVTISSNAPCALRMTDRDLQSATGCATPVPVA
jgi:hypothetical protein